MKPSKIHLHSVAGIALLAVLCFFMFGFANSAQASHQFICRTTVGGVCYPDLASCQAKCGNPTKCEPTSSFEDTVKCPLLAIVPANPLAKIPGIMMHWATEEILYAITGLINFVNSILRLLITLAGGLFNATLLVAIAPLSDLKFISLGWKIVRDVCNIFFIFILLTIAIATILRIESYGAKKLLPKLIIAALLINFSLVIAGAVVDASNVLAFAFIQKMYPVSDHIAKVIQITTLDRLEAPPITGTVGAVLSGGYKAAMSLINGAVIPNPQQALATAYQGQAQTDLDQYLLQAFLALIMTALLLVMFFVLIALSILVILRTASLMLLFVLAPIGFLGPVLPATQKAASDWWHKLFSWSFFLPAASFFVYLTLQYGEEIKDLNFQGTGELNSAILFNYIVIVILLCGSVVIAQKMGAVGAGAVVSFGKKLVGQAKGYAGKQAAKAGLFVGQGVTALPAKTLGRIPVVGGVFAKPYAAIVRQREKAKEEKKKQYTGLTKAAADATLRSIVNPLERRRAIDALVEEGKHTSIVPRNELNSAYLRYKQTNNLKAMKNAEGINPLIAAHGETDPAKQKAAVENAVSKMSVKDIEERMDADALKNEMVQDAMLIHFGEREVEAALKKFGTEFADSAGQAYERLSNTKGPDKAFDEVYDKNRGVLKLAKNNPLFSSADKGVVMQRAALWGNERKKLEEADKAVERHLGNAAETAANQRLAINPSTPQADIDLIKQRARDNAEANTKNLEAIRKEASDKAKL